MRYKSILLSYMSLRLRRLHEYFRLWLADRNNDVLPELNRFNMGVSASSDHFLRLNRHHGRCRYYFLRRPIRKVPWPHHRRPILIPAIPFIISGKIDHLRCPMFLWLLVQTQANSLPLNRAIPLMTSLPFHLIFS